MYSQEPYTTIDTAENNIYLAFNNAFNNAFNPAFNHFLDTIIHKRFQKHQWLQPQLLFLLAQ